MGPFAELGYTTRYTTALACARELLKVCCARHLLHAVRVAGEQKSPDIGAGARTACRLQAGGGRNLAPAVEQFSF